MWPPRYLGGQSCSRGRWRGGAGAGPSLLRGDSAQDERTSCHASPGFQVSWILRSQFGWKSDQKAWFRMKIWKQKLFKKMTISIFMDKYDWNTYSWYVFTSDVVKAINLSFIVIIGVQINYVKSLLIICNIIGHLLLPALIPLDGVDSACLPIPLYSYQPSSQRLHSHSTSKFSYVITFLHTYLPSSR